MFIYKVLVIECMIISVNNFSYTTKVPVTAKLLFVFLFQMALLPEGITELLHHEQLRVPLVCWPLSEI